jgi:hypothetical protein
MFDADVSTRTSRPSERRPPVQVLKLGWVGTRTDEGASMADFVGGILGIPFLHGGDDLWVFQLPDGAKVEVFGPGSHNPHLTTGPVPGFVVEDVASATEELRAAGVPIVHGPIRVGEGDNLAAWVHFLAPDGRIYEVTEGSDLWL